MNGLYESVREAASFLQQKFRFQPVAAMILGTGLGGVADRIDVALTVPYEDIPHFPLSTVEGHKGNLLFGTLAGCDVLVLQGRFHYYEGYSLQEVTLPVRVMKALGAELLLVNSAAGGLNPLFRAGDVMIVTDHINMLGDNPLRGRGEPGLGNRFPDMTRPYDPDLIRIAGEAGLDLEIPVRHGVYVAVQGPSLETRAETRMLRMLGADAVGMSTVPEVIVAAQVGFRTLALAAITNVNLPDAMEPVLIENVIAQARSAEPALLSILAETLGRTKPSTTVKQDPGEVG